MNRRLAKSRLSSRCLDEKGSAVAEFSLLAVPLSLLLVASVNFCLNVYVDSVFRFQAIATARFASLADVTLGEANSFAAERCEPQATWLAATCIVNVASPSAAAPQGYAVSTFSYQPIGFAWFRSNRVVIHAQVANETSK